MWVQGLHQSRSTCTKCKCMTAHCSDANKRHQEFRVLLEKKEKVHVPVNGAHNETLRHFSFSHRLKGEPIRPY